MPVTKKAINKKILTNTFGSKCQICGYDKCLAALEFHHKDPSKKEYNISKIAGKNNLSYEDLKEICKCILVCANCHREIGVGLHKEEIDNIIPVDITEFLDY